MFQLLTRADFRKAVMERTNSKCAVCGQVATAAHHILERRLWDDGGYYLENGIALCDKHHLEAESTFLSCAYLRQLAKIDKFPLPAHLPSDTEYDKWGNPLLANGMRLQGELFHDASVQKVLADFLHLYTTHVKYPRTYHLPWSEGASSDDKKHADCSLFEGKEVVVTVKMDGENTTLYRDGMHARSLSSSFHPSRTWVKKEHARFQYDIPDGWRVCGENLYAQHSIPYTNLRSYFLVFSVWNEKNECLSWDETVEWATLLDLVTVDVLYRGVWDEKLIRSLMQPSHRGDVMEGYVVRASSGFAYRDFRHNVGKVVRKNHVQTEDHWTQQKVVTNSIAEDTQ